MKKTKKKNNLIKFIMFSLLLIPIVGVTVKLNESSPGNKPIINVPAKNENVAVDYDNQTIQTSNIKIVRTLEEVQKAEKSKLCILNESSDLSFKVVDKLGKIEEISTLSTTLPQTLAYACCAKYEDNVYIFGGSDSNGKSNKIYKFNCTNKIIETLSVTLLKGFTFACCASYGDNIYIFGGEDSSDYSNAIYKFNCTNETIETLSVTLPQKLYGSCCSICDDNIYIFGGSYGNYVNTIYKFNCTNETIETLSVTLPQKLIYACCASYGDNIYIFGGYHTSMLDTIYKFNCTNETITTLSTKLPQTLFGSCCSINDDNIYMFGGNYGGSNPVNTIFKFNCTTETINTLSTTIPQVLKYACCSIYNSNMYLFGGENNSSSVNTIYQFVTSFELTANNVLIYNANSNYSFDLITDQVTIPIKNVYIGDSNNNAQLANAYLYDETQTAWVNVNTGLPLEVGESNA